MNGNRWTVPDLSGREPIDIIIGDDRDWIETALDEFENTKEVHADGSARLIRELVEFERLLDERDISRVVLAFQEADRHRFFGTLRVCRERDIEALVHVDHAPKVFVKHVRDDWVTVDFEPFSRRQRAAKRIFDVAFAIVGLVALAPLIALIALAIKLDTPWPVLYTQARTGLLGKTFHLRKFRSMVTDAEAITGPCLSDEDDGRVDPRVTGVGRILRQTHMDEIPQLWSVLRGAMSVVGPRPERPELDDKMQESLTEWPKRWNVKPGLTGPAQVNEVTGYEPAKKLAYDLEYIERQSFLLDVWFVMLEIKSVILDALSAVQDRIK